MQARNETVAKAVAYLAKDVVKSNDPDAARALMLAAAKGYDVGTALDAALVVLKQPGQWPKDQRIRFAAALTAAERHGKAASTDLEGAAKLLVADQQADGSYGSALETWLARTALIASGMQPDNFTIVQIDKWARGSTVETLADAIAAALLLELSSDVMADNLRRNALSRIRQDQRETGAFGGDPASPAIVDTALAVVALSVLDTEPRLARSTYRPEELKDAIANGKKFLMAQQQPDGSWRGPVATTAWAVAALLSGS